MDPRWTFEINEVTASVYDCRATREGRRTLSRVGSDDAIGFLLYDVFCIETGYGTMPEEAAFHLVAGYFPEWRGERDSSTSTSWLVESIDGTWRISYDEKIHQISVSRGSSIPLWHGSIDELRNYRSEFYRALLCSEA